MFSPVIPPPCLRPFDQLKPGFFLSHFFPFALSKLRLQSLFFLSFQMTPTPLSIPSPFSENFIGRLLCWRPCGSGGEGFDPPAHAPRLIFLGLKPFFPFFLKSPFFSLVVVLLPPPLNQVMYVTPPKAKQLLRLLNLFFP